MVRSIRRLRLERTGRDRVGVAPPVQQEILVLHVRKLFWVESHADKMETGVEAVDLEGILDIVVCRAVTVVVCIKAGASLASVNSWQGIAAQDIGGGVASRARIQLLLLERGIKVT